MAGGGLSMWGACLQLCCRPAGSGGRRRRRTGRGQRRRARRKTRRGRSSGGAVPALSAHPAGGARGSSGYSGEAPATAPIPSAARPGIRRGILRVPPRSWERGGGRSAAAERGCTGRPFPQQRRHRARRPRAAAVMASILSKRLGKRSLLGARVCTPSLAADGMTLEGPADLAGGAHLGAYDGACFEESPYPPGNPTPSRFKLYPGQKVYVTHNGQECAALVEQHNHVDDEVKIFAFECGLHLCRKTEDVRLAETPRAVSAPKEQVVSCSPSPSSSAAQRMVSRSIDVPKRRSDAVDMDEMMAAMVLTSLSCSPIVQSPPCSDIIPAPQVTCDLWKESGDVSDSGSSTTSGHWSVECGASTPSPPHTEASPKYTGEVFSASHVDEGFETDPDPFLLDEPAPRKRKNSVKVMYKCLWPNCGKLLRSIVGIKRHVKTQHLGDGMDTDQRKREEDFYYTEVQMKDESEPESTPLSPCAATAPLLIQPMTPKLESAALEVPCVESPLTSALSQSAPGSFWHIQADHAYQALPSIQIPVSPHIFTSISWAAAAPSTLPTLSPIRSRSLSFSEQQQPPPTIKSQLIVASPPRASNGSRKVRGEAKKCRKVYGIEHRDQWCTACRWKKACQRFLD